MGDGGHRETARAGVRAAGGRAWRQFSWRRGGAETGATRRRAASIEIGCGARRAPMRRGTPMRVRSVRRLTIGGLAVAAAAAGVFGYTAISAGADTVADGPPSIVEDYQY